MDRLAHHPSITPLPFIRLPEELVIHGPNLSILPAYANTRMLKKELSEEKVMFSILTKSATFGLLTLAYVAGAPSLAHAAPTDIPTVIDVCAPVISEEYDGNVDRWGQCVAAVKSFLDFIGTPQASTDATVGDLVVALTELYRDDVNLCKQVETELPEAILLAAERVTDEDQKATIIEISATIADCARLATAAIGGPVVDPIDRSSSASAN